MGSTSDVTGRLTPMDSAGASARPDEQPTTVPGAVVVAAVLVAAAAVLWGLDERAAWLDEAISRAATTQLSETIDRTGGTMASYYVLLDGWTGAFGDSITTMRLLSLVFVALTVIVVSRMAARLLDPPAAILATIFVAVLPGMTRYGQEARSYALTALIAAASWLALINAVRGSEHPDRPARSNAWWVAVTLLSVLGVLAHGLFLLQVAAQALSLLVGRRRALYRFAPAALLSFVTVIYLFKTGADYVANWVPPLSGQQGLDVGALLLSPSVLPALALLAIATLGTVTAVQRSSAATDQDDRWLALVPVFWALVPLLLLVLLSAFRPYFLARYLVASLPGVALLLAAGSHRLADVLGSRFEAVDKRTLLGVTASACIALLLVGQVSMHREQGDDWRGAAVVLAANIEPSDAVLFTQPDLKLPFDTAWNELDEPASTTPTPIYPAYPLGEMHRFPADVPREELEQAIDDTSRLWVVHSTFVQSKDQLLDAVLDLPVLVEDFEVTQRWHFDGDLQLVLLERIER